MITVHIGRGEVNVHKQPGCAVIIDGGKFECGDCGADVFIRKAVVINMDPHRAPEEWTLQCACCDAVHTIPRM